MKQAEPLAIETPGAAMGVQTGMRGATGAVVAGIVAGIDTVGFSIALAVLMFAGPLAGGLGIAASAALLATAIIGLALGLCSGLRGNLGHAQDIGVAVLAPALATMAAAGALASDQLVATAFAIIAAASLATGLLMYLTGWLGLGRMVRFFPQTVVAGFLAGTGWLMVVSGIAVAAHLSIGSLFDPSAWTHDNLARVAAVVGFAASLWFLLPRIAHPAGLAVLLAAGVGVFHAILWLTGQGIGQAQAAGWLPVVLESGSLGSLAEIPRSIDWATVLSGAPVIGIVALLSLLAALMNTSALEVIEGLEVDHNAELRVTGLANMACGAVVGPPGYAGLASSMIAGRISPSNRGAAVVMAAVAVLGIFFANALVSTIPIFVTAGLIVFLGVDLLHEWLVKTRRRYTTAEWMIVLVIVIAVATAGFVAAVVIGLAIAVALFAFSYARIPVLRRVQTLEQLRSTLDRDPRQTAQLRGSGASVAVYELQGFLFFGTAERLRVRLRDRLMDQSERKLRRLILDFGQVSGVDSAALALMDRIGAMSADLGVGLVFSRLRPDVAQAFERATPALLQSAHVQRTATLDEAIEAAEEMLLGAPARIVAPSEIAARYAAQDQDLQRLSTFFARLPVERLARGARVLIEGEPADGLVLIEEGRVAVFRKGDPKRAPQRLRAMSAGSIIGDIGFATGGSRTADIVAETDVVVRRLSAENLRTIERDDPALAQAVSRAVMRALAEKVLTANRAVDGETG